MRKLRTRLVLGLIVMLLGTLMACSSSSKPEYHRSELTIQKTVDLDYLLYTPAEYDPKLHWPLVLYLSGMEAVGNIDRIKEHGPPLALAEGLDQDFFLLAPQLPGDLNWDAEALMALLQEIQRKYQIDESQLYVTGSGDRGGWAAWDMATTYPDIFSRIAPIAAPACTEICRLGAAAVHIYHGALDSLVPLADAENMRFELEHYCQSNVELIVYDTLGHEIWDQVYADPAFWQWFTGSRFSVGPSAQEPDQHHFFRQFSRVVADNYLLYMPRGYQVHRADWPLVIFLHGSGSAIEDIEKIREGGPPKLIEEGMDAEFLLLAPQLHANVPWDVDRLYGLIRQIMADYHIDADRIYLTGLSRGGFGCWELAVAHPELFAALAPISARDVPAVERLANSNIWIFHGGADDGVPWQGSQFMYDRLTRAGANVQFSLFQGVGHNAWDRAYADPEFWSWLLAQRLTDNGK